MEPALRCSSICNAKINEFFSGCEKIKGRERSLLEYECIFHQILTHSFKWFIHSYYKSSVSVMKTWQQQRLSLCVLWWLCMAAQAKESYCYSAELAAALVGLYLVDFSDVTWRKCVVEVEVKTGHAKKPKQTNQKTRTKIDTASCGAEREAETDCNPTDLHQQVRLGKWNK